MPGLAVNVVVIHKDQVLLTQRDDLEVWCLPSGGVEPAESLAQAAVRETLEETGVEVDLTRLVGVYSRHGAFQGNLYIALFAGRPAGGALRTQPGETIAVRYFAPEELPDDLAVGHGRRIQEALQGTTGAAWQQRLVPRLFDEVNGRQELYDLRDRSGLPRAEFWRQALAGSQLEEALEVGGQGRSARAFSDVACPL